MSEERQIHIYVKFIIRNKDKILTYVHYQKNGLDSSEPYWKWCFH